MEENGISLEPEVVADPDPEPVGTPPASKVADSAGDDDHEEGEEGGNIRLGGKCQRGK
ncbi:hypothetical protein CCACVL1_29876 [Corchorus capsularis]|uniref:Uncharacterized protein n=1 Tax=Corchorus capsularis TaxID=210143 RepID=A0A1R3FZL7_COCAP|nr:hypothetical protein CCACVL1_29876 [Corchorus capsularis]